MDSSLPCDLLHDFDVVVDAGSQPLFLVFEEEMTGRVQFTITGLPAGAPRRKSGRLRVLATAGRG